MKKYTTPVSQEFEIEVTDGILASSFIDVDSSNGTDHFDANRMDGPSMWDNSLK